MVVYRCITRLQYHVVVPIKLKYSYGTLNLNYSILQKSPKFLLLNYSYSKSYLQPFEMFNSEHWFDSQNA